MKQCFVHLMLVSLALLGGAMATSCHRASQTECEAIVERIVRLELSAQKGVRGDDLDQRVKQTLAAKQPQLVAGCVGKRVSSGALTCIQQATTSQDVTDKCLQ